MAGPGNTGFCLCRSYPFAGSGWALVFAPALGTVSRYFSRTSESWPWGTALTGSRASSLLLAPALQLLLDNFGWRGSLLLLRAVPSPHPCGALPRPWRFLETPGPTPKPSGLPSASVSSDTGRFLV